MGNANAAGQGFAASPNAHSALQLWLDATPEFQRLSDLAIGFGHLQRENWWLTAGPSRDEDKQAW